jgi:hypothetical protein
MEVCQRKLSTRARGFGAASRRPLTRCRAQSAAAGALARQHGLSHKGPAARHRASAVMLCAEEGTLEREGRRPPGEAGQRSGQRCGETPPAERWTPRGKTAL